MSESEPQVPLTAQEWLDKAHAKKTLLIHALQRMQFGGTAEAFKAADDDLDKHLAARPQEQEAKEAERYRVIRGWGSRSFGVFVSDGNNPLYEAALDRKIDAAIAAQSAQGKTA